MVLEVMKFMVGVLACVFVAELVVRYLIDE